MFVINEKVANTSVQSGSRFHFPSGIFGDNVLYSISLTGKWKRALNDNELIIKDESLIFVPYSTHIMYSSSELNDFHLFGQQFSLLRIYLISFYHIDRGLKLVTQCSPSCTGNPPIWRSLMTGFTAFKCYKCRLDDTSV